jgi:hypothetical protein
LKKKKSWKQCDWEQRTAQLRAEGSEQRAWGQLPSQDHAGFITDSWNDVSVDFLNGIMWYGTGVAGLVVDSHGISGVYVFANLTGGHERPLGAGVEEVFDFEYKVLFGSEI